MCYSGCGHGTMVDLATRMISEGYQVPLADVKRAMENFKDPMAYEKRITDVDKMLSKLIGDTRNRILPPGTLSQFLAYSQQILDRGISKDVAKYFGIRFDMVKGRIAIPIYDHQGNLRGVEGRNMEGSPKYSPIVACDKGTWLWGAWLVPYGAPLVVFEGALGAARATSLGIKNATALLGSSYRKTQFYRLAQSEYVTIALDPDKAGRSGSTRLFEQLHPIINCHIANLPADIDDISASDLQEALSRKF